MDTPPIASLPSSPATSRVGKNRDQRQDRGKNFEHTFRGGAGESDDSESESTDLPISRSLQNPRTRIRKNSAEGEHHIDVMA